MADPLILTLALDGASFARLDGWRRAHFPPGRNDLRAHLTMFHSLPGAEEAAILVRLAGAAGAPPPPLRFAGLKSLGRGVAVEVASPGALALRAALARDWAAWLTPQDRQGWRPHVTIQNKVAHEAARALLAALPFEPWEGRAEALLLWRYRGGPWEAVAGLPFRG